jgi:hypothetical protein
MGRYAAKSGTLSLNTSNRQTSVTAGLLPKKRLEYTYFLDMKQMNHLGSLDHNLITG